MKTFVKEAGHLIIGVLSIASVTVLAAMHDITGATATEVIVAVAGVTIGAHIATS